VFTNVSWVAVGVRVQKVWENKTVTIPGHSQQDFWLG